MVTVLSELVWVLSNGLARIDGSLAKPNDLLVGR
jgi:hypothetical protein